MSDLIQWFQLELTGGNTVDDRGQDLARDTVFLSRPVWLPLLAPDGEIIEELHDL